MIISRLRILIAEKENRDRKKITYRGLAESTGLSTATIGKLLSYSGVNRIDGNTLSALCEYFDCNVGDILVYEKRDPEDYMDLEPPEDWVHPDDPR